MFVSLSISILSAIVSICAEMSLVTETFVSMSNQDIASIVGFTFDVNQVGTVLFKHKSPSHDVIGIEIFISQILMICIDHNLLAQQDIVVILESFHNCEYFVFCCGIAFCASLSLQL